MLRKATSQVLLSTHTCIDRTLPLQAIPVVQYEIALDVPPRLDIYLRRHLR